MTNELLSIIDQLEKQPGNNVYASLLELFNNVGFPFPVHTMERSPKQFFRVREDKTGKIFFDNESELTFRKDVSNITSFGRCNEPSQSMFYCSDNNHLSFCEVSALVRKRENLSYSFYTTSVWQMNSDIRVSHVLENRELDFNNELLAITANFLKIFEDPQLIGDKLQLREFLLKISTIFRRQFSADSSVYMLGAAYSNYLFGSRGKNGDAIEGLVYPTCLGETSINNLGLNYAFLPEIVGYNKKIELKNVYRSKMELINGEYYETETICCKSIDRKTGTIKW